MKMVELKDPIGFDQVEELKVVTKMTGWWIPRHETSEQVVVVRE